MNVVEVDRLNVEVSRTRARVARDVCFEIEAGKILALVGESGSGKTTVAMALLGHTRRGATITGGTVRLAGADILSLDRDSLRAMRGRDVSYIPQNPGIALNPSQRVGRQVAEVLETHGIGLPEKRRERVAAALQDVALPSDDAFLNRYPHELSGGQQQRLMIAMAFIAKPRAIVLDEPTTGLDILTQAHVLSTIRDMCRRHKVCALYITHDLAVVAEIADSVMVMLKGEIVEVGDKDQVLHRPAHRYTRSLLAAAPDITAFKASKGSARAEPLADKAKLAVLSGKNLSKSFGRLQVLHGLNFELRSGEVLALVGQSGSGKTTLGRSLMGLSGGCSGEIRFKGDLLPAALFDRSNDQRRTLQYIYQNPHASMNPRRTIAENVSSPFQHFFGMSRRDAHRRSVDLLAELSLPKSIADAFPREISGGECQRASIARALACSPDVIICDEITSALDVSVQASIIKLLQDLSRERGLALLFITHNIALVASIADSVAVMQGGTIVDYGPTARVLGEPRHPYTIELIEKTPSVSLSRR
ncbi:ABC transporter ATP-binding protein [Mesorhizobium sp. CA8]|uniref:ABC transporter ATP-binding protein n=1 Tax=unclassified Mesorhizobium TaxID=325217 RepID=UPI001CCC5F91|nr:MULTISPECIES: ABC transporter ATP-binding protein [unclassified Mesorhizobium]MBZ9761683.1 ABC transporter ATP-binding protein [Mesorhizobium sp. CA8]MBZ9820563.1 ABC transporter ATP-binding protein [Mesorhizobium sp. CA4]